jgi:hypothetical protein
MTAFDSNGKTQPRKLINPEISEVLFENHTIPPTLHKVSYKLNYMVFLKKLLG